MCSETLAGANELKYYILTIKRTGCLGDCGLRRVVLGTITGGKRSIPPLVYM
jgi:hypothetical protein